MSYLIAQIVGYLAAAFALGLMIGWWAKSRAASPASRAAVASVAAKERELVARAAALDAARAEAEAARAEAGVKQDMLSDARARLAKLDLEHRVAIDEVDEQAARIEALKRDLAAARRRAEEAVAAVQESDPEAALTMRGGRRIGSHTAKLVALRVDHKRMAQAFEQLQARDAEQRSTIRKLEAQLAELGGAHRDAKVTESSSDPLSLAGTPPPVPGSPAGTPVEPQTTTGSSQGS